MSSRMHDQGPRNRRVNAGLAIAVIAVAVFRSVARRDKTSQHLNQGSGPGLRRVTSPVSAGSAGPARPAAPYRTAVPPRSYKQLVRAIFSILGIVLLAAIAVLGGWGSFRLHQVATADPAALANDLAPGSVVILFNQPVTGTLDATQYLQGSQGPDGLGSYSVVISGQLHRSALRAKELRWEVLSVGALKFFPTMQFGVYPGNEPPPGGSTVFAANYDPRCQPGDFSCDLTGLGSASNVPGNLTIYCGSSDLGGDAQFGIYLGSDFVGPVEATGGGRVEGLTGAIGGWDVLNNDPAWQGFWNVVTGVASEPSSWKLAGKQQACQNFAPQPDSLTVNETIATSDTDSVGSLNQDTSIITGASSFQNPGRLAITWKPGQSSYRDVSWELENRLLEETAQSQDFLAGVFAAVAASAALMALALFGSTIREAIVDHIR
jgi:hypothetical protein